MPLTDEQFARATKEAFLQVSEKIKAGESGDAELRLAMSMLAATSEDAQLKDPHWAKYGQMVRQSLEAGAVHPALRRAAESGEG